MIKQSKLTVTTEAYSRDLQVSLEESNDFTYVQVHEVINGIMIYGCILIVPSVMGYNYVKGGISHYCEDKDQLVENAKEVLIQDLNIYKAGHDF